MFKSSEMDNILYEYIHNEKYRKIMHYRLIDGYTYEVIAEKVDMSVRQTKEIVYKCKKILNEVNAEWLS